MATQQEIMTALRNADAAGDTSAAQRFASMIQPQPVETPQEDPSLLTGAADIAGLAGTEMLRSGLQGITTVGGLIDPFSTPSEAVEQGETIAQAIPEYNLGEDAKTLISGISEKYGKYAPDFLKEIVTAASTLGPSVGESVYQATGSPLAASLAGAVPGALEAATGLRPARAVAGAIGEVAPTVARETVGVVETTADVFTRQSPAKQKIAELIKTGATDRDTAGYKLAKKTDLRGRPKIEADPLGKSAINQGFDEGVIASIKGSSGLDKQKMIKMVNVMERGKKNQRYAATNRPSDVLGDSVMNRLRIVQGANKEAGKALDDVAKGLKVEIVDFSPAVAGFIDDLTDMGITIKDDLSLDFKGSDIEGLAGPESVINRVVKRMTGDTAPSAYDGHRLKRFIDEQVTYGKNAEGLSGRAESVLKKLRVGIDSVLDENFPEYDRINTAYSETIGALDAFQDVAGKKMNLTGPNADKATGTLMRRVLSNAQSRVTLLDSVEEIEKIAKKYEGFRGKIEPNLIEGPQRSSSIQDDLLNQVLFVDELDAVFGPVARTSFQGQIKQAAGRGAGALAEAQVSPVTAAIKAGAAVIDKVKGVNEKAQFKSIKDLLKQ